MSTADEPATAQAYGHENSESHFHINKTVNNSWCLQSGTNDLGLVVK